MPVITRKIQIVPAGEKDERNATWETMRGYEETVFRMANYISTHAYVQDKATEFTYFTEGFREKLADRNKDEDGVLITSQQNTTYRMLSSKYKGEVPSDIMTALNSVIRQTFSKEKKEYFIGSRSLRSYRKGMPIPIRKVALRDMTKHNDNKGNYTFTLYGMNFKTFFGRDLSGNEIMFDRAINQVEGFKLCDSSIQIKDNKIFLLACIDVPVRHNDLDDERSMFARLSVDTPIEYTSNGADWYAIGNKEEYLHRRLQIQAGLRRAQIDSRFNKCGKGRKKKMAAIERYHKAETNYVTTKIHQYTAKLIDTAIKRKCGKLVLQDQLEKEDEAKQDEFLLRNWTYYGMKEKIEYKCRLAGITLVVE